MRISPLRAAATGFAVAGMSVSCVDMPSYVSVVQPPILSVVPYSVGRDACTINRKVMIAPVELCGTMDGRSNKCFEMTLKIRFLGNQALYYDSLTENSGIVFEFGKTINLVTDPRQDQRWRSKPRPGVVRTAFAEAFREGDLTRMGWQLLAIDAGTGRRAAVAGQSMSFRIASCSNSCQVLDYSSYMNNGRTQDRSDERLAGQSCHLE